MKQMISEKLPRDLYLTLKRWNYKRSCKDSFERTQAMRAMVNENGYSYKPFDDKKAIFVHIPKCAGVSINQTIFGNLAGGHTTLEEYLSIFEPRSINSYFKFTIVRNPWDRLVSAYFFLKKGGFGEMDQDWYNAELSSYSDFEDFVKKWVNRENIWKWHHFRPQHHYIVDRQKKVPLDFIGFLENLDNDFSYITRHIGITCDLPQSNKSKHESYKDYYTDETRRIVEDVYSEDINLLGYNFDNSSLPHQLAARHTQTNY